MRRNKYGATHRPHTITRAQALDAISKDARASNDICTLARLNFARQGDAAALLALAKEHPHFSNALAPKDGDR